MITNHRVSLRFARFKDRSIGFIGRSILTGLANNPFFPDLPVSLADLEQAVEDYENAHVLSMGGGRLQTSRKNAARARLISILRDEAHYVQIVAKNNLPALLSSGFTDTDRNTAQTKLSTPYVRRVLNQSSGQLTLRVNRVRNARSYEVRLRAGDGDWFDAGTYSQARNIVLLNLIPGTVYGIQVRAFGGSTGCSDWSMATSKMAT